MKINELKNLDKLLIKQNIIRTKIDYFYDEIEYFTDLIKVIKLTNLKENPNFLLDFLNNEDNAALNKILSTLNLTVNELKNLSNVNKLYVLVNNELKQLKIELKKFQL